MADKKDKTDKEQEKRIRRDMEETKKRYDTVIDKMWNLETRMGTMSRDQAENLCAIQSKLNALLRNSIAQEKTVADKTEKQPGTRVDCVDPQRKKQECTPLPQIDNSLGSGMTKTALKGEPRIRRG